MLGRLLCFRHVPVQPPHHRPTAVLKMEPLCSYRGVIGDLAHIRCLPELQARGQPTTPMQLQQRLICLRSACSASIVHMRQQLRSLDVRQVLPVAKAQVRTCLPQSSISTRRTVSRVQPQAVQQL
jgi:hypothetical protein